MSLVEVFLKDSELCGMTDLCSCCKGSGRQKHIVTEMASSGVVTDKSYVGECFKCGGVGRHPVELQPKLDEANKVWCRCGNPSGETTYHEPPNATEWVECHDCGKATQIG